MSETAARASMRMRCPNDTEPDHEGMMGYDLIVRQRAGRWLFACTDCAFHWSATDAEVRRLTTRRMVKYS